MAIKSKYNNNLSRVYNNRKKWSRPRRLNWFKTCIYRYINFDKISQSKFEICTLVCSDIWFQTKTRVRLLFPFSIIKLSPLSIHRKKRSFCSVNYSIIIYIYHLIGASFHQLYDWLIFLFNHKLKRRNMSMIISDRSIFFVI